MVVRKEDIHILVERLLPLVLPGCAPTPAAIQNAPVAEYLKLAFSRVNLHGII